MPRTGLHTKLLWQCSSPVQVPPEGTDLFGGGNSAERICGTHLYALQANPDEHWALTSQRLSLESGGENLSGVTRNAKASIRRSVALFETLA